MSCKPATNQARAWAASLNEQQLWVVTMILSQLTDMGMCRDCALNMLHEQFEETLSFLQEMRERLESSRVN